VLLYWAFIIGTTLARVVPVRLSYAIARLVGYGVYYAWPGGRRRCVQNMRHVTGGDEAAARRVARASLANYVVYLVDFFRLTSSTRSALDARARSESWERGARERTGNGIVVMTMHFGNWDMGATLIARSGVPVTAIADRLANARVNDFVVASRRHLGMTIVPADRMGPALMRALRRDEAVAVVVDVPTPAGIPVTFFGETILVPDGAARIALRSGALIVAGLVRRVQPWAEDVEADASIIPFTPTGDTDADVRALTQTVFTHFEDGIRRYPEQWYVFRNLWPADAARPRALRA